MIIVTRIPNNVQDHVHVYTCTRVLIFTLGSNDGSTLGFTLDRRDGSNNGSALGYTLGSNDGTKDGSNDGSALGFTLGSNDAS